MLSIFKKKETNDLKAYVSGTVVPIEEVNDPMFSSKAMGDGVAIKPSSNMVTAPCRATVKAVMKTTKHAVGLELDNGLELLIHVGVDTVKMKGQGFELFVEEGDTVKAGAKLIQFDSKLIQEAGYDDIVICALINGDNYPDLKTYVNQDVQQNETIIVSF